MTTTRRNFLAAGGAAPALWAAPAGTLRAGASTSNITPALGCVIAGNMTASLGTEVHDELHVRTLVLDDGRTRVAISTCDVCVLPRDPIDRAKKLIADQAGIPPSNLLIAAVHTHSAPATAHLFQSQPDPNYVDWLVTRIADGVRRAVNHLEPARIGWGVGREDSLVFNRRYLMKPGTMPPDPFGRTTDTVLMNPGVGNPNVMRPAGPVDPDVGVLAVEALDGRPISVIGNYALHYVGGVGPGHISADYFAAWADAMRALSGTPAEDYPPFVPILTNACSGNINNVDVMHGSRAPKKPYEQMRAVAGALARETQRVWRGMEFTDSVQLSASVEEVELGVRLPSAADVDAGRRILDAAPKAEQYKDHSRIYAREALIMAETFPRTVRTPVQAFRIGPLGIVSMPGEAFVELGFELKAKSALKPLLIVELANDYRGYIPTVEAHAQGGYETWRAKSSYLETQAAPKLVAAALRQLERVAKA